MECTRGKGKEYKEEGGVGRVQGRREGKKRKGKKGVKGTKGREGLECGRRERKRGGKVK